ncbi:MAG: hypothetical protein E7360_05925 [Clostridiales bacterium]|nr:hypothetical protein [Clostridiales bacterium]
MKAFTKIFKPIFLFVLALSLLVACDPIDNDDDKPNGPITPSVSANEVINQSIAKMEDMMDIEINQEVAQPTAFVVPNYNVDYDNERLSVLRGSGIGLYFSQYIATEDYNFEDNTVYKDTVSEQGITLNVHAKKTVVDGGVNITLENHQTYQGVTMVMPIHIYFEYDYTAEKPSRTTIVSVNDDGSRYELAVAQFDYSEEIAYSYNFVVTAQGKDAVKAALTQKNLNFDTLIACDLTEYVFAKLAPSENTIQSYGYKDYGTDEITATQDEVAALYASIYDHVKNACVPVEPLDVVNAVQKVYYQDMYTYAVTRIMAIQ